MHRATATTTRGLAAAMSSDIRSSAATPTRPSPPVLPPEVEQAHLAACQAQQDMYVDPLTGLSVFTAGAALRRGFCCGRACRHCPYGHVGVVDVTRRVNTPQQPVLIPRSTTKLLSSATADDSAKRRKNQQTQRSVEYVLSWSGGKDSYLSFLKLVSNKFDNDRERARQSVVMLTTFDYDTRMVPEQNISLDDVMDQVTKKLAFDLVVVPLKGKCDNATYVDAVMCGVQLAEGTSGSPVTMVFGDLHLADIRTWRETNFVNRTCAFPIFNVDYQELKQTLFSQPEVRDIVISKANHPDLKTVLGVEEHTTCFDLQFCDKLRDSAVDIDEFGERGEFHTFVRFVSGKDASR